MKAPAIISQVSGKELLLSFYSEAQAEKMPNTKTKGKQKTSSIHLSQASLSLIER